MAIIAVTILHLWPYKTVPADTLQPVEVALGNWAPVIEEAVPGHGAVTEKITIVLRRMGYRPVYSFIPWGQAEHKVASNETDSGPRVTFPFLDTKPRQAKFIYSEKPVFHACMKFFYHKGKVSNPDKDPLKTLSDLKRYRIGYVADSAGYQYPDSISSILRTHGKSFPGLYEAFERLINDNASDVQIVPVAQKIGEHLLIDLFPGDREKIGVLRETGTIGNKNCLLLVEYYLLVSRKNPNNSEFMDGFNKQYASLLADKETVARIDQREKERGGLLHPLVELDGSYSGTRIIAETESGKKINVPRGTKGILYEWSSHPQAGNGSPQATATVQLINGPYRGITVTLSGEQLRLK